MTGWVGKQQTILTVLLFQIGKTMCEDIPGLPRELSELVFSFRGLPLAHMNLVAQVKSEIQWVKLGVGSIRRHTHRGVVLTTVFSLRHMDGKNMAEFARFKNGELVRDTCYRKGW